MKVSLKRNFFFCHRFVGFEVFWVGLCLRLCCKFCSGILSMGKLGACSRINGSHRERKGSSRRRLLFFYSSVVRPRISVGEYRSGRLGGRQVRLGVIAVAVAVVKWVYCRGDRLGRFDSSHRHRSLSIIEIRQKTTSLISRLVQQFIMNSSSKK